MGTIGQNMCYKVRLYYIYVTVNVGNLDIVHNDQSIWSMWVMILFYPTLTGYCAQFSTLLVNVGKSLVEILVTLH